jgi:hypothetical protein
VLRPLGSFFDSDDVHVKLGERRLCDGWRVSSRLTWIAAETLRDDLELWNTFVSGRARGRGRGRDRVGKTFISNNRGDGRLHRASRCAKKRDPDERHENATNDYDAILVLAGGQVPGGGVPVWVERHLDKALELQQQSSNGALCKIVLLGGGTPHRAPILSPEGFVVHESTSCAEYLLSKGAPSALLFKEWASYDTIGNGYFSLTQHVIPRRWRTLAVVTSEFHMPRTRAVFEWIYGLQGAGIAIQHFGIEQLEVDGVVPSSGPIAQGIHLEFYCVPDQHDFDETIAQVC